MKQVWENLSPKYRRYAVVGGALGVVAIAVTFGSPETEDRSARQKKPEEVRHILTDSDTRAVGLDSLAANMSKVMKDNENMREELTRMRQTVEAEASENDTAILKARINDLARQLENSRKERVELTRELQETKKVTKELIVDARYQMEQQIATEVDQAGEGVTGGETTTPAQVKPVRSRHEVSPEEVFTETPKIDADELSYNSGDEVSTDGTPVPPKIRTIAHIETEEEKKAKEQKEEEKESVYLPSGSILSGVLITGMDAPTGEEARRDPHPVLVRVQKEAVLPNKFRADIRECFMTMSGWGQLSSERAYIRSENVSCVREDGGVIEARVEAYAVGEDGKVGVRGKVVSKQGLILARAMQAGFAEGVASAFDKSAVPVVQTADVGSEKVFQDALSSDSLQSGAVQGFSSALDRLAQFYIDMASDIFPVIEISAGRSVQLILTKGVSLRVKS